ncbi:MAG: hypothetical protein GKR93_05370 [Gammaproteobacteria bacterium]|nr:hypothetical protein [Gammaproteobacteria bacterium]
MLTKTSEQLVCDLKPEEFFQEALEEAVAHQNLSICVETLFYLRNLLTTFIQTEQLYQHSVTGEGLKPLAGLYADALDAPSTAARDDVLRHLGDLALFIAGLFPQSLSRSLVDVDYYINMGGCAYGFLAESGCVSRSRPGYKTIFSELSVQFAKLVDVLTEVGDQTVLRQDSDVLRLYEIWLASGSKNAAGKLRQLGIQPLVISRREH